MDTWAWPQYAMAIYLVMALLIKSVMTARDQDISSGGVAFAITILISATIFIVATLHAGRFW